MLKSDEITLRRELILDNAYKKFANKDDLLFEVIRIETTNYFEEKLQDLHAIFSSVEFYEFL